jgi:tRNA (guanine-N7-)-methyltransferase
MDRLAKDNRNFPYEFNANREVEFYPIPPKNGERLSGDILEVGPGLGHFLLALAESNPDKHYLAIESQNKRFHRIAEKAAKMGVTNVTIMKGYAQAVIPLWLQSGTFERVYVLFPDPWPKTRHARNRLLTPDFISILACLLRPGGELFMATDHAGYARWIIEAASQVCALSNIGDPFCHQSDVADYLPTIFEQKWRKQGKQIAYMRFVRNENNPSSKCDDPPTNG